MKKAVKYFIGEHDFKHLKQVEQAVRVVLEQYMMPKIYQNGDKIYIELTGNGFI